MIKRIALYGIVVPLFIILGLLALIVSPLGNPLVRYSAQWAIDGLTIANIEGSVLSDYAVKGLYWEDDYWLVSVDTVQLNVVLGCSLGKTFCIEYINLDGVRVKQKTPLPESEEPESSTDPFVMPLPVKIADFSLTNLQVDTPSAAVKLASFKAKLEADKKITIPSLKAAGLIVALVETETQAPSKPKGKVSYAMGYHAPDLPEIQSPIPVEVSNFEFQGIQINPNSDDTQNIADFRWQELAITGSKLSWEKLHVEHTQAVLDSSGEVVLSDKYPLQIDSRATIQTEEIDEVVTLTGSGSLADLTLSITAEGTFNLNTTGQANLLSDMLPVSLTVRWPEQALIGIDDSTLWQGDLSLEGQMGSYTFTADSGATLKDIGPVPVNANVTLNTDKISVNTLTVAILDGKITNSGDLFLNETVSWFGKTALADISSKRLSSAGPENINGGFTSLMQLTDDGIEVSVTDLDITGEREGAPLSAKGFVVYSQSNDIVVTNLAIKQQRNFIRVLAQIYNTRYINADIDIDVPEASTLYPDVAGAITGKIKAAGPWQDPIADGNISLREIAVSPALNSTIAEQGKIDGDIAISGSLTNHELSIDMALPEHFINLTMHGSWLEERYNASINTSELGILTTRWQLNSPFSVTAHTTPFNVKVSQHCWEARAQGQLCIDNIVHKDERTTWEVNGKALPAGLWVHELFPDTFTDNSNAKLAFKTAGEFSANAPMKADFDLSVSPATWTLGPNHELKLSSDTLSATGTFNNDVLDADVHLQSEQLGAISANLNVDSKSSSYPLTGNIQVDNVRIAPLKPMSKAIRELAGNLNGQLAVKGTLTSPYLSGELSLKNGTIDIEDAPVNVADWQQVIHFTGQQANFNGTFLLGEGKGSLEGDVSWDTRLTSRVKLKGQQFQINQPDIRMRVSPNLSAELALNSVKVEGEIDIPWARIEIEALPENAVSPSKDVHLRGEPPPEDPLDIVDATVMVNIDKQKQREVKLEAFGLTANLHGGIEVRTHPALVGYGDLQILDGRYQAYGQDLVIQTGEVQFNGPLDQPMLLVEAIRDPDKTEDGVIAGIRIDGAADSPNINLFSEPAMNQSNSLSYLLTGRGPGASSSEPNYNALLLGFGLSSTEKIQGQLGNALGIEDFSVGTTSSTGGGSTKLSVSGRINDRLTVQYNVDVGLSSNSNTTQTLRRRQEPPDLALRYRLLPKLFVEAVQTTIEEQSEFAVDFYYEFFLGGQSDDADENNKSDN